jgi:hypothetical protein
MWSRLSLKWTKQESLFHVEVLPFNSVKVRVSQVDVSLVSRLSLLLDESAWFRGLTKLQLGRLATDRRLHFCLSLHVELP